MEPEFSEDVLTQRALALKELYSVYNPLPTRDEANKHVLKMMEKLVVSCRISSADLVNLREVTNETE